MFENRSFTELKVDYSVFSFIENWEVTRVSAYDKNSEKLSKVDLNLVSSTAL